MKPRYSIVRVDNNCPFMQEKFDFSSCSKMFNCDKFIRCEKCENNCRYGDTKEQLIMKVAQVIRRYRKNLEVCDYCDMKDEFEIAEKIVEFLGVEE